MMSDVPSSNHCEEDEEEEIMVYIDLDAIVQTNEITNPNTNVKIIGMDSAEPVLQINDKIFKGTYDYALGTNAFFKETQPPAENPEFPYHRPPEKSFELFTTSNKVLRMRRIFIEKKSESEEISEENERDPEQVSLEVTKTYQEALDQLLQPGCQPPRQIVEEDFSFLPAPDEDPKDKDYDSREMDYD